jgi:hypothetical protein
MQKYYPFLPAEQRSDNTSEPSDHNFQNGICANCSLRQKDAVVKTYQFCQDELKVSILPCNPSQKEQIVHYYAETEAGLNLSLTLADLIVVANSPVP